MRGGVVALLGHAGLARFALFAQENLVSGLIDRHVSFLTEEDVADEALTRSRNGRFAAGRQAAHFEHQLGVAEIERGDLGVRRFLVVIV